MSNYNSYFSKFPSIEYNGYKALDITRKTKIIDDVYSNPYAFYPYDIKEGERVDLIANRYYQDPYASWVIYHSNKIVDPYYDWHQTYYDFSKFIEKKYGSIEYAQKKVKYYRVDWAGDDQVLAPSYYENTLADSGKKYFTANFAPNGKVISYKRKDVDWIMNTNMIIRNNVSYNSNTEFEISEIVTIKKGVEPVGNCEVVVSNTSTVTLQHINIEDGGYQLDIETYDELTPNGSFSIIGQTSNASANINTYTLLQKNIPVDEQVYWSRVTEYDYEEEQNNLKRSIYILDLGNYPQITEDLRRLLKS